MIQIMLLKSLVQVCGQPCIEQVHLSGRKDNLAITKNDFNFLASQLPR